MTTIDGGTPAGDQVLRNAARLALRQVRLGEEAFRVGGEEFAIVIDGTCEDGIRVAERIRAALESERHHRQMTTISAGVASFPAQASERDELVARADLALYAAKRGGKNRVVRYDASLEAATAQP
jgi:diguanylate cyclase (GGDEF)-like protein